MKKLLIGLVCAAVGASLLMVPAPAMAQQKTEKQCRDEWRAAGGRKATGKTEKDYVAGCHVTAGKPAAPAAKPAAPAAAAPAAPAPAPAATAPAAAPKTAPKSTSAPSTKPASGGRAAEIARERACGKDWKADKAAGKIPQGMTWPKYWSECNKRKKAEGM